MLNTILWHWFANIFWNMKNGIKEHFPSINLVVRLSNTNQFLLTNLTLARWFTPSWRMDLFCTWRYDIQIHICIFLRETKLQIQNDNLNYFSGNFHFW